MKLFRKLFNRVFLVFLAIVLQVLFFVLLIIYAQQHFFVAQIVLTSIAVIFYCGVVSKKEPPEFKIPWITILLLLPAFGIIIFILFYPRRVRKKEKQRIIFAHNQCIACTKISDIELMKHRDYTLEYSPIFDYLRAVTSFNGSFGNDVKYYQNGELFFQDFINNLKEAEHFIFFEFFIISQGEIWNKILEILKEKAAIGVEIRIIIDDIGSNGVFSREIERELKICGIKIYRFNPFRPIVSGIYNNRDHRKIAIIDHKYAFTGGMNIGDEYANVVARFGYWKDTMVRIKGKAITNMIILFLENYDSFEKTKSDYQKYCLKKYDAQAIEGYVFPFGDGPQPYFKEYISESVYINMLNEAKNEIYISTPYLIPTYNLLSAVRNAALRGVEVHLIMPGIPDKKMVYNIGKSHFKYLIQAGVNIYIYQPGFNHMKTVLVDNVLAYVGTANFDYRSLIHHFENGVLLYKCQCLKDIKLDFINMISESVKVDQDTYKISFISKLLAALLSAFSTML